MRKLFWLMLLPACTRGPASGGAQVPLPTAVRGDPPAVVTPETVRREEPVPVPEPVAPPPPRPKEADDDLGACVAEINHYRTGAGKPALKRSAALEAWAAEGARLDGTTHRPHNHFSSGSFPGSYSGLGENELPWWPRSRYSSMRDLIHQGVAAMWAEGPGGGHHDNIVGDYSEVGCGIFVQGDEVTVVQDFRQP